MKHNSPKQLRKKKHNPYIVDGLTIQGITLIDLGPRSIADRLPLYDEYNPNKIHVARRRQAHKDHRTFPRGWTWGPDEKPPITENDSSVNKGRTATLFKDSDISWYIDGVNIS